MAKKATQTAAEQKKEHNTKIPRGVSKHIRLLKSQGRADEAEALRKSTIDSRKSAE